MKEEIIRREIIKMKKIFKENNYSNKEILLYLEAKEKVAKTLNDEIILITSQRIKEEMKGEE